MSSLKELITKLQITFKKNGFEKKTNNFYYRKSDNYGVVNFQKSRNSDQSKEMFTVNLGVYSELLSKEFRGSVQSKPDIADCHWNLRIGQLIGGGDHWWTIDANTNSEKLCKELEEVFESKVFPLLTNIISDEELIVFWLNKGFDGNTEFVKYQYLTYLMVNTKYTNTTSEVNKILTELKGNRIEENYKEFLKEIKYQ